MFAFLLCDFTVVHFTLLFLWLWQPGYSEHAVSQHLTRMLPLPKYKNAHLTHTLIEHKVLLVFRLFQQFFTSQWEFDGLALAGHLSDGHLSRLPGHLLSHTGQLQALLQQTKERQDTLISLCSAVNVSNVVKYSLDVIRVFFLIAKTSDLKVKPFEVSLIAMFRPQSVYLLLHPTEWSQIALKPNYMRSYYWGQTWASIVTSL